MTRSNVQALFSGLASSLSIVVGYLPIGFSFGVAASQAGVPGDVAILISLVVYAGASQFLLLSLITSGASLWTTLPTVLLMNARHALYGPAVAGLASGRHRGVASPWLAFGLTDEVFATAMSKLPTVVPEKRDHWLLGLQMGAFVAWTGGTFIGLVLAGEADLWPSAVKQGLTFVLPALFFSLLMETGMRRWRTAIMGAVATTLLLGTVLASHHALALGIVAGALVHALFPGDRQHD